MDITRIYNYYPEVALSDLSDAFSEATMANGNKLCIISYLSKTLRIGPTIRFTNKYVLFLQNTATADINWSYTLHNDETSTTDNTSLIDRGKELNDFVLEFGPSLLDADKNLKFNRLTVNCKVTKGTEVIELEIEHAFVKMIGVDTLFSQNMEHKSFIGNPDTTNFLVNYVRDYFPKGAISWNNLPVTLPGLGEESLINYVASLLYYKTLTYFDASFFNKTYYDIGRHDNPEIEALILSETMGEVFENTNNGICELPLHLLSDMTTDFTVLPDFLNIASTNKIYEMLSRPLVFGPDLDNYTLNETESAKLIKESKGRLVVQKAIFDGKKLVDLYNLSRFPKSAIKLSAILFKFLFEASRKNDCKECLYKEIGWKFLTLDGIKTKEDFIKNIYSHYLEEPVNKVLAFRRPAQICAQYAWSPYIYTMLNFLPRITNAYFAKKVVVEKNGQLSCFFRRIDSKHRQKDSSNVDLPFDGILGREVYMVIETLDLQGKELVCQVLPETASLTRNTNKLGLLVGNLQVEDHKPVVGNFTALENNANSSAHYTNLKKHHSDKAFIKLYLRPQSPDTFDWWTTNLGNNMVNLEISVQMSDPGEAYFGDGGHGTTGIFLNTAAKGAFRVVNRIFYEIFEPNNNYNYVQLAAGGAGRLIGKRINNQSTQVVYYYHDENDNEHYFGEFTVTRTPRWPVNPALPNDLITMVEATRLVEYNKNGVHIRFLTDNSPRDFINLDCFSGLLGAMAVNDIADLGFNGFSMIDGSPGASTSHINGVNGDLRYLRTDLSGQACLLSDAQFDFNRQVRFNNSLHAYGWGRTANMLSETFTRNNQQVLLPHTAHFHRIRDNNGVWHNSRDVVAGQDHPQFILNGPLANTQLNNGTVVRHNNHLHLQGFDFGTIFNIL